MNTLQPRGSSHHRVASSSSYAPILINPSGPSFPSSTPSSAPSSARLPLEPRIRYPYPLPIFTLIDLAYTFHHDRGRSVSSMSFTLCIARAVVLGIVLGCSTRWRNRGGWIGAVSGCSIGYAVWSVCEAQLTKGKGTSGAEEPVQALFLGITAGISALEYITFLLLLRLSPPHHRPNPLALRLPHSAVQRATEFDFDAENVSEYGTISSVSTKQIHRRYSSRHTFVQASSQSSGAVFGVPDPAVVPDAFDDGHDERDNEHDEDDDEDSEDEYDYEDEGEGERGEMDLEYGDDLTDTSSISESSIIDLPPPMSPSRIVPPAHLSVERGLDILDQTPVLGAVVRRTRSARFLGRSPSRNEEDREGYGTFVQGQA